MAENPSTNDTDDLTPGERVLLKSLNEHRADFGNFKAVVFRHLNEQDHAIIQQGAALLTLSRVNEVISSFTGSLQEIVTQIQSDATRRVHERSPRSPDVSLFDEDSPTARSNPRPTHDTQPAPAIPESEYPENE